ncbi:hypothetical protein GWK47_053841 [Chionoecetes opilio]|uniref:Uncharacterized protein n=1 Tax=Chionoecetes opilio TaxID=41210 RepID=A0A8J4Y0A6_CHIOP|nr:hypothetical protein GWK47_053841 [Chionoecetes opilio]
MALESHGRTEPSRAPPVEQPSPGHPGIFKNLKIPGPFLGCSPGSPGRSRTLKGQPAPSRGPPRGRTPDRSGVVRGQSESSGSLSLWCSLTPWVTVKEKRQILTSLHTTVGGDEFPAKRPKLPNQAVSGFQRKPMASTNMRRFFQKLRRERRFSSTPIPRPGWGQEDFRTATALVRG